MPNFVCKLEKELTTPIYLQIYQQVKSVIEQGELKLGDKLPSKRKLADLLAVSQTTVETAYAQLQAEGYIESRPRSGFLVSFDHALFLPSSEQTPPPLSYPKSYKLSL